MGAVRPYSNCTLVTLSGAGSDNSGRTLRVLAPFDDVEFQSDGDRLDLVRGRRWRRVCHTLLAAHGTGGILRTAWAAQMDLMGHQLEPALALVHGLASRVLIADEVGLGKTVQAALAVAELRERGAVERVLVLTPAGLREQWAGEFTARFGLSVKVADVAGVRRLRADLPAWVNPWAVEPMVVASIDYVKRPEVLAAVQACRWDLLVVDEAHTAASDSDRRDAASALCARAPYVLLLTATPHNGDARAFASLCALGRQGDRLLVFRRTREEVGVGRPRRIHRLQVRLTAAERQMHGRLAAFADAVQAEAVETGRDIFLALATLHKRALSSAHALEATVRRRLDGLGNAAAETHRQLALPLGDPTGETDPADDVPAWMCPALRSTSEERELLGRVLESARLASSGESKISALARLLRRLREPVIVFTEYRDTLLRLRDTVASDGAVIHGGLSPRERGAALDDFAAGRTRVLLATDAAGEGLNLQHAARVVINVELPWNPVRLEQRIGRVDRIGQDRRVHVFHLIARGSFEAEVFRRLEQRLARARADVGAADPLGLEGVRDSGSPAALARAILAGPETAPEAWVEAPAALEGVDVIRLSREADAERARLAAIRKLRTPCSLPEVNAGAGGVLAMWSRRRGTRARLRPAMLVVQASTLTDRTGRVVATYLTPFAVDLARWETSVRTRADVRNLVARLDALPQGGEPFAQWLAEAVRVHRAFWLARSERDRRIRLAEGAAPRPPHQLDLFYRRAHRGRGPAGIDPSDVAGHETADRRAARPFETLCLTKVSQTLLLLV